VILTRSAIADLRGIREYIRQFNPDAAARVAAALVAAVDRLRNLPDRGRGIGSSRRELLAVWPYVIRYRIDGEVVVVLRVRHGKRRPIR